MFNRNKSISLSGGRRAGGTAREDNDQQRIAGNIYRGRVVNVLPGMQAAFVDIGLRKMPALCRDINTDKEVFVFNGNDNSKIEDSLCCPSIQDLLKEGRNNGSRYRRAHRHQRG